MSDLPKEAYQEALTTRLPNILYAWGAAYLTVEANPNDESAFTRLVYLNNVWQEITADATMYEVALPVLSEADWKMLTANEQSRIQVEQAGAILDHRVCVKLHNDKGAQQAEASVRACEQALTTIQALDTATLPNQPIATI